MRTTAWQQTFRSFYGLITGFLERGESPEQCALREVKEELDLVGTAATLIGVYPLEQMNQVIIAYHVAAKGTVTLNHELDDFRHVPLAECKAWSGGTGFALRDWLRSKGFEPPMPRCVVHLIPLTSIAGRASVNVTPMYYNGYQEFMFPDWGGATRDFNLDGLVVYPGKDTAEIAYTQIFRNCTLEAARYVGALNVQDPGEATLMWSSVITGLVRTAIVTFLATMQRWNVAGPAVAAVALLDIAGFRFAYQYRGGVTRNAGSDRPNLILPEVWIEQLTGTTDADAIARPLLDTLWQAFGVERCLLACSTTRTVSGYRSEGPLSAAQKRRRSVRTAFGAPVQSRYKKGVEEAR